MKTVRVVTYTTDKLGQCLNFTGITLSDNQTLTAQRIKTVVLKSLKYHIARERAQRAQRERKRSFGRSPHFRKIWLVGAGQLKICNACCPAGPAPVATAADQHQVNDGLVHTRNQLRHILSRPSGMPTWHCLPTGVVHSHATAIAVPLPRCFATDEDARGEPAAG